MWDKVFLDSVWTERTEDPDFFFSLEKKSRNEYICTLLHIQLASQRQSHHPSFMGIVCQLFGPLNVQDLVQNLKEKQGKLQANKPEDLTHLQSSDTETQINSELMAN